MAVGMIRFLAGEWDEARCDLDTALTTSEEGQDGYWADVLAVRAMIAVHRGQLPAAQADLDRAIEHLVAGGSCWYPDRLMVARALLLEASGQPAAALGLLQGAWQLASAVPLPMALPALGPFFARCSVAAGDRDAARDIARIVAGVAEANPGVARLQGAARWCEGIEAADPEPILTAVGLLRAGCRPLDLGLASEDAAAAFASAGRLDEARTLLGEALEQYGQLLASQRVASALARLRSLGVRMGTRGARKRPATGWDALTETEVRVVRLLAENLSNPEIAQRMVLSRRTVETHVSHCLAKLRCASRRQLVPHAAAHPARPDERSLRLTGAG
jgi:DNA-binding CsgD family transcriptional regulator